MLTVVVIVLFLPVLSIAQGIRVKGYVYDFETKAPLAGANIVVHGALSGTSTNTEGFFNLIVEKTPVLIYVSYVGYMPQQLLMQAADRDSAKIYLKGEIRKIGEVTITGEKIANLIKGDTLNIVDYEITDDRIVLVANPFKHIDDQRLYLTMLSGEILGSKKIRTAGQKVEIPESIDILNTLYLFKDCFRSIQLLTKDTVFQIGVHQDQINLLYPSSLEAFEARLLPVKAALKGCLYMQQMTLTENKTYCIKEGEKDHRLIKTVYDRFGRGRVEQPAFRYMIKKSYEKCVSAPVIKRTNDIAIFDFFGNNIEFFNQDGISISSVPISFHNKEFTNLFFLKMYDIDLGNFTQQILYDEKVNRIWSLWTHQHSGHYTLKEVDPDTGEIIEVVEIPDYPFIEKIQVHNNIVYFLYTERNYPNYRSLYRMMI